MATSAAYQNHLRKRANEAASADAPMPERPGIVVAQPAQPPQSPAIEQTSDDSHQTSPKRPLFFDSSAIAEQTICKSKKAEIDSGPLETTRKQAKIVEMDGPWVSGLVGRVRSAPRCERGGRRFVNFNVVQGRQGSNDFWVQITKPAAERLQLQAGDEVLIAGPLQSLFSQKRGGFLSFVFAWYIQKITN